MRLTVAHKDRQAVGIIPKVAGTTIGRVLTIERDWVINRYDEIGAKDVYGLVRHPLGRWVSGIATYYTIALDLPAATADHFWHAEALKDPELVAWYIKKPFHDNHTFPQVEFWKDSPGARLFKMENIGAMWKAMGIDAGGTHANHYENHPHRVPVQNVLRGIIEMSRRYQDMILSRYAADLTLYERAE